MNIGTDISSVRLRLKMMLQILILCGKSGQVYIIVIIKTDGKGTYNNVEIKSNFLTGYYGRNKFAIFISNNVNADTFLYINKKRSQQLSNSAKVQFLGKLNNYDFDIIIRKTRANVKTNFPIKDSTGRELSKGQIEYFKDSTVRDEDGNLLVMYHGTPENFTVFAKKKARASGTYGSGFYFTREDNHAKHYGEAKEYYLKIDNPLSTKEKTITKPQLKKFLEVIAKDEDYGLENYGYNGNH